MFAKLQNNYELCINNVNYFVYLQHQKLKNDELVSIYYILSL